MKRRTAVFAGVLLLVACAKQPKPAPEEAARKPLEDLRAAAVAAIKDPARAADMSRLIDRLEREVQGAIAANRAHLERLGALDADYDAAEEEFRKALADFNADRAARQGRVLALRDSMISVTSEQEWDEIARARARALESIVKPH